MNIRTNLLATVLLAFTLAGCFEKPVEDSDANRKVLATEAAQLTLTAPGGTFDAILDQAVEVGTQHAALSIQASTGRELTKSEFDKLKVAFKHAFSETYPAKDWVAPFSGLYERSFSAPELDELLRFYKSPAGQKYLRAQGMLATEGAKIGLSLVQSKEEQFQRALMSKFMN